MPPAPNTAPESSERDKDAEVEAEANPGTGSLSVLLERNVFVPKLNSNSSRRRYSSASSPPRASPSKSSSWCRSAAPLAGPPTTKERTGTVGEEGEAARGEPSRRAPPELPRGRSGGTASAAGRALHMTGGGASGASRTGCGEAGASGSRSESRRDSPALIAAPPPPPAAPAAPAPLPAATPPPVSLAPLSNPTLPPLPTSPLLTSPLMVHAGREHPRLASLRRRRRGVRAASSVPRLQRRSACANTSRALLAASAAACGC
jgi:hypothetical protein